MCAVGRGLMARPHPTVDGGRVVPWSGSHRGRSHLQGRQRGCDFALPPAARRSLRLLRTLGVRLISRPLAIGQIL
jgi:hypothetical protein